MTVTTFGDRREGINPYQVLLNEIEWSAGHVEYLRTIVMGLPNQDALVEFNRHDETVESIWVRMYRRERELLTKLCDRAIALGIAERTVRLQESQGKAIAFVIRGVLGDMGVWDPNVALPLIKKYTDVVREQPTQAIEVTSGAARNGD